MVDKPQSSEGPVWSRTQVRHASRSAADQIKEAVLAGLAGPGDRIGSEKSLGEKLGVGRSTMREAVKTLEAQGLVAVEPGAGGGIRIAPPQSAHFQDALAIQIALMNVSWSELLDTQTVMESATAAAAAKSATEQDVLHLRSILSKTESAIGDPENFARYGVEFHVGIGNAANNQLLAFFLSALGDIMTRRYADRSSATPREDMRSRHRRILTQHRLVCETIAAGDSDMAMKHMSEHLQETRRSNPEGAGD